MTSIRYYTQACFEAWMNCENLLSISNPKGVSISKKIAMVIDECALICMGTFHAIKSSSRNANRLALLCVGICEECADLCEAHNQDIFRQCAKSCRDCSEIISQLAFANLQ